MGQIFSNSDQKSDNLTAKMTQMGLLNNPPSKGATDQEIIDHFRRNREHHTKYTTPNPPYFPYATSIKTLSPKDINKTYSKLTRNELEVDTRHLGKVLYATIVEEPFTMSAVHSLLKDANGDIIKISFYECGDQKQFQKGVTLAIFDPYYKIGKDDLKFIRVDSHDSLAFLKIVDLKDIELTHEELKLEGNRLFQQSKYSGALTYYSQAIEKCEENPFLFSNRSLTNLHLGKYRAAKEDALSAIEKGGRTHKFLFRLMNAFNALRSHRKAIEIAREIINKIQKEKQTEMKVLAQEIRDFIKKEEILYNQMVHGNYDMLPLSKKNTSVEHQIEEYVSPIQIVKIEGKGRGIIAMKNIKRGELICVSKSLGYKSESTFKTTNQGGNSA